MHTVFFSRPLALVLVSVFSILFPVSTSAQIQTVVGQVSDREGKPLSNVNISIEGTAYGTVSATDGRYTLNGRYLKKEVLVFSKVGYKKTERNVVFKSVTDKLTINITLEVDYTPIAEVRIQESRKKASLQRLEPKSINKMPTVTGGVESLVKALPGVFSNNEMSSQYSVRGGNFDENLVYVNGIEVYRPFLIRTGEQEGLSFVNPDMVESVYFSAGGFSPEYGDKMSSVLDITYKKPKRFAGSVSGGLLGASAHLETSLFSGKLKQITGVRYKNAAYILNSLETDGDYRPSYLDLQSFWTLNLGGGFELGFLGTVSQNTYIFKPEDRTTNFGTKDNARSLYVDFEGGEEDKYSTMSGALQLNYKPNLNTHLSLTGSFFHTSEQETYDLEGEYLISAQKDDQDGGSDDLGTVVANLGLGRFIDHGRNYLEAYVANVVHRGKIIGENTTWEWGAKFQHENIKDRIHEWEMLDSAGYSMPPRGEQGDPTENRVVKLSNTLISDIELQSNRFSGFAQGVFNFGQVSMVAGIRAAYWSYNQEWIVSPRANITYRPINAEKIRLRAATGLYSQQPFYREMRDRQGKLIDDAKAQRSIHVLVGSDYDFKLWGRPFRVSADVYYKQLCNLIPYEIDNLRIRYFADQQAHGYSTGIDVKINGEFVKGTDSWLSFSLMRSREDVQGDNSGYIPRPTDQAFQVVAFFQDYFPNNDTWKIHLAGHYGAGLPFGPPDSEREDAVFTLPNYKRVDIGLSKKLFHRSGKRIFGAFKSIWLRAEVFNILGINNTVSMMWFRVVPNTSDLYSSFEQYGVPNRLTGRRLNVKLTARF